MEAILSQKKAVAGYAAAFGVIGTIGGRSLSQSMPDGIASPLGDGAFWRDRTKLRQTICFAARKKPPSQREVARRKP